ncbi:MAG: hypothetical protein FWC36_03520 [Spirochaetes bacterium]|nr:hypothetical protein [Spirochaetota bacterium]
MERKLNKIKSAAVRGRQFVLRILLVVFAFTGIAEYAGAFNQNFSFPETHFVRRETTHLMRAPISELDGQRPMITDCFLTGRRIQYQVVFDSGFYYFIFINERAGSFPMVSAGTYVIRRDARSGVFDQMRIFLNNDPNSFVRVIAQPNGSKLELSLFNSMIYRNVRMPITIDRLITEPFETIIRLSDYIVNWDIIFPFYNETENRFVMNAVRAINEKLPMLNDSDDGAQAEDGSFVFIRNSEPNPARGFNCSGFAKWVADGVFYPRTNRLMDVDALRVKNLLERRNTLSLLFEDERDPLFGLDWTRNIAMTIFELDTPGRRARFSDVDVRNFPYEVYSPDIGFSVGNLKVLLYYLAVTSPGYMYLGSVNGDFGRNPVLRQHYHVAVFLPYICPQGNFYPVVFERNIRRPIEAFIRRNATEFIHLVRIKLDENFTLPDISFFADDDSEEE